MQKTEITTNNGTFLFIEIPDDAYDIYLNYIPSVGKPNCDIRYKRSVKKDTTIYLSPVFNFNLEIISTTKDITEEQSYIVIDSSDDYGENDWSYNKNYVTGDWLLKSSKESLQSLIQANGLDINKNYLIVKKL